MVRSNETCSNYEACFQAKENLQLYDCSEIGECNYFSKLIKNNAKSNQNIFFFQRNMVLFYANLMEIIFIIQFRYINERMDYVRSQIRLHLFY